MATLAATGGAEGPMVPRPMAPTSPEKLPLIGSPEGMALFPAEVVPGYPGMDPDPAKNRPPRNMPELVNYPGSIEHYTPKTAYQPRVNPFN